ncbi:MAG: hypothetical protein IK051_09290 [Rhodocyclaceae bacterium]|nr:hypothetical protein [Rhodocyclaceae bacterium]
MTDTIKDAYRRIDRAYGGRSAYESDKQAERTKLERLQWVTARTLAFKHWLETGKPCAVCARLKHSSRLTWAKHRPPSPRLQMLRKPRRTQGNARRQLKTQYAR